LLLTNILGARMSLRLWLLALASGIASLGCGSDPQDPPTGQTGEVAVTVTNAATDLPLDGVTVQVAGQTRQTAGGVAEFDSVPVGTQQVSAALDGFVAASTQVEVVASERRDIALELTPGQGPPAAPQVVRAYGTGRGTVQLEWKSVVGATAYRVYVATSPGVTPENGAPADVPLPQPNFPPLYEYPCPADANCYFVVTAVNAAGEGPPSLEIFGRAGPPMGIRLDISFRGQPVQSQLLFLGDTVGLSVTVTSDVQIVDVDATVAGRSFQLTGAPGTTRWDTYLLLEGVPHGPVILTVTVRDANGQVNVISTQYLVDRPPTLTVLDPVDFSVARPQLRVRASCEDDAPSCAISVGIQDGSYGPLIQRVSSAPVDQIITLSSGTTARLTIIAEDSVGSFVRVTRTIPIEPSTRLVEVAEVPGPILDATTDRILWTDPNDSTRTVVIRDRVSGADAVIFHSGDKLALRGTLTASGALFLTSPTAGGETELFDWRGGTAVNLGPADEFSFDVAGPFALWGSVRTLFLRDLVAGTTEVATNDFAGFGSAVAPNGDVLYSSDGDIFRVRNGVTTAITNNGTTTIEEMPETDGTNVVFTRRTAAGEEQSVILDDGASEENLATFSLLSGPSYLAVAGWLAFARPSSTVDQVWVRAPAGDELQVSAVGQPAMVETLASNGSVFFKVFGSNARYLALPPFTSSATLVSATGGRGLFIDGQPFVVIGRSLFGVN
jgi:hypothetical protein